MSRRSPKPRRRQPWRDHLTPEQTHRLAWLDGQLALADKWHAERIRLIDDAAAKAAREAKDAKNAAI